ncbi:MAG: WD40 repeat domain-containing protein, partial [Bacteroidota bacterium]
IILRKLWMDSTAEAQKKGQDKVWISRELYQKDVSKSMQAFFEKQLENFRSKKKTFAELVDNGWLYEVLFLHTTDIGTATSYQSMLLADLFGQKHEEVVDAIRELKNLFLLVVIARKSNGNLVTLLAHDTLAPIVRRAYENSDFAGQRARRILYGKMRNVRFWFAKEDKGTYEHIGKLGESFFEKNRNYDLLRENVRKALHGSENTFNDIWPGLETRLQSDLDDQLDNLYLSKYEIETIKAGEHGMRKTNLFERKLIEKSKEEIEKHERAVQEERWKAQYNLALAFEVQATRMMEEAGVFHKSSNHEKAWLYSLHALNQEINEDKSLPVTLRRVAQINLGSGPFRKRWKSYAYKDALTLEDAEVFKMSFSKDTSQILYEFSKDKGKTHAKFWFEEDKTEIIFDKTILNERALKGGGWQSDPYAYAYNEDFSYLAYAVMGESQNSIDLRLREIATAIEREFPPFVSAEKPVDRGFGTTPSYNWRDIICCLHPYLPILVVAKGREVFIKDIEGLEYAIPIAFEGASVEHMEFSKNGKLLLLYDSSKHVCLFNLWNIDEQKIELERVNMEPYPMEVKPAEEQSYEGQKGGTKPISSELKMLNPGISPQGNYYIFTSQHESTFEEELILLPLGVSSDRVWTFPHYSSSFGYIFSPDERYFAYISGEYSYSSIRVYDLADNIEKPIIELDNHSGKGYIASIAFHPDNTHLLALSSEFEIMSWSLNNEPDVWMVPQGNRTVLDLAFDEGGHRFYTASYEGLFGRNIHDSKKLINLMPIDEERNVEIPAIAAGREGILAMILSETQGNNPLDRENTNTLQIWKLGKETPENLWQHTISKNRRLGLFHHQAEINRSHLAMQAEAKLLAIYDNSRDVKDINIFDIASANHIVIPSPPFKLDKNRLEFKGLSFDQKSNYLAASWKDHEICLWEIINPKNDGSWQEPALKRVKDSDKEVQTILLHAKKLYYLTDQKLVVFDLG